MSQVPVFRPVLCILEKKNCFLKVVFRIRLSAMRVLLAFLLFVLAGAVIAYDHYDIAYWRTPPEVRADQKWAREIAKVKSKSKKISKELQLLNKIELVTTDQQFKDLIDKSHPPFKKTNKGNYVLKVQIMPFMEDMKYGYLIQHEIFDQTENKVTEFNINIDIGYLW